MTSKRFTAALAAFGLPAAALAHGPVVQITIVDNKIVTRSLLLDAPYGSLTPPERLYTIPMALRSLGDINDGWYGQVNSVNPEAAYLGPGIAYGLAGFATGASVRESFADGLKFWNGTSLVDPGVPQIQGLRGSIGTPSTTLTTTDAGPFAGFSVTASASVNPESHSQVYWRLLGDGVSSTAASPDGVYLLSLQLSTTQPGIVSSDPFYVLFTKNATAEQISGATAYVNANLVPEPAGLAMISAAGLLLCRRKR